ncbi:MAG: TolC family protein [Zetaproteobacteria bacterium CG12_big_fil_rev_8_21_14_0_65_55_1124]|nr:MAG: TolC family protein [Zetaproteobacteria bacterium CG08_land_8_20_14_0_20_55_17]PIW43407.1 MAG: TolC family protein [Zetaproteobacteria bacterium CG12_big_fil_rev_8_21_14_0_65_55_1124]PIY53602.1 MAG: TolC family protein [Zetaproteobacteria bacterium CG_4_10_14_0_8_um_filter_55_43]PIZ37261.1 MAG: TolC family protein [Zetaproteobacteria bacterium CG_4_10_14_0_2_um_filter_55_20]PJB81950.1 MAG: TolC family protein [Zetaproteobacteria bacterium CG_4_9_14_0_8_um_filter_55_31]
MTKNAYFAALFLIALTASLPVAASGLDDPFSTADKVARTPSDAGICDIRIEGKVLSLADIVQFSLCNNPQTRAAWASARSAAAQLGVSESSRLPTLSLSGAASHSASATGATHTVTNQQSASLSASYLLYDFGGREAGIDNALELLAAANASGNATLQTVFLNASSAYFSLMSARASVEASRASEAAARESLAAALARYQAGVATPADRLQAKTALAQSTLTRVTAEGTMYNALGTLANAMGVAPTVALEFSDPAPARPDIALEEDVGKLIAAAQEQRPDLAAAEARIRAANASIDSVYASGMPQLTVDATASDSRSAAAGGNYAKTGSGSIALNLSFPVFTGFRTTYQTRAAEAQLENSIATRDQLAQQVTLQVWQAYQNLRTQGQALRTADDLLASASESEAMSLGRYREGVGNILDLLSAQSAMANARQQHVTALYNWHAARFSLAQALGALDLTALQKIRRMEQ